MQDVAVQFSVTPPLPAPARALSAADIDLADDCEYNFGGLILRTVRFQDVGLVWEDSGRSAGRRANTAHVQESEEGYEVDAEEVAQLLQLGLPAGFGGQARSAALRPRSAARATATAGGSPAAGGSAHQGGQRAAQQHAGGGSAVEGQRRREGSGEGAAAGATGPSAASPSVPLQWQQAFDASAGQYYYYCEAAQETQWEPPVGGYRPAPYAWSAAYHQTLAAVQLALAQQQGGWPGEAASRAAGQADAGEAGTAAAAVELPCSQPAPCRATADAESLPAAGQSNGAAPVGSLLAAASRVAAAPRWRAVRLETRGTFAVLPAPAGTHTRFDSDGEPLRACEPDGGGAGQAEGGAAEGSGAAASPGLALAAAVTACDADPHMHRGGLVPDADPHMNGGGLVPDAGEGYERAAYAAGIPLARQQPRRRGGGMSGYVYHKYWSQRYSLFSRYDKGVLLDDEGWYSATPEVVAAHQAAGLMPGGRGLVVDAFCGAGGNAIALAVAGSEVVGCDLCASRLELAAHNARVYGVAGRLQLLAVDFFQAAPSLQADAVFLSPPWGGPDYHRARCYDVMSDDFGGVGRSLPQLLAAAASALQDPVTGIVACFLPRNSNLRQLAALVPRGGCWLAERCVLNGIVKGITLYCAGLQPDITFAHM